jgi:hypothetical protein
VTEHHVGGEHRDPAGHEVTHGDPGGLPEPGDHEVDAHGHDEQSLGPIDLAAWGASLIGVASGLLICFLLYLAVS